MATPKLVKINEKIAEALTEIFFNVECDIVNRYIKIEDTFVETYPAKEGETTAEAKERLLQERAQWKQAQRGG